MRNMMKIYYFFIVFMLAGVKTAYARDVQETVLQAHKLYKQGQIEQAVKLYDSIEKKGPATWYNMGNCYYKLGNYLDALICWKRAEHDASWTELSDIHHNIDQAYKALGIQPDSKFMQSLYRHVIRYLSICSLYGLQLLFLAVWLILLFLSAQLARRRNYIVLGMLSVLVMLLTAGLYMKHDLCNTNYGIVRDPNLVVYTGPDKAFHEQGSLTQADQITICEQQEAWLKVRRGGLVGWVPYESIALV